MAGAACQLSTDALAFKTHAAPSAQQNACAAFRRSDSRFPGGPHERYEQTSSASLATTESRIGKDELEQARLCRFVAGDRLRAGGAARVRAERNHDRYAG